MAKSKNSHQTAFVMDVKKKFERSAAVEEMENLL